MEGRGHNIAATTKFRQTFGALLDFLLKDERVKGRVNFVRHQLDRSTPVPTQRAVNRAWFVGQLLHELESEPALAEECQALAQLGFKTDEHVIMNNIMGVAVIALWQLRQ